MNASCKDYARIEKAILFIQANTQRRPELSEIAAHVGLSEFHFQRLFQRWAGISPKTFLQFLTKEYAVGALKHSNVLDASYASGLSGPGRLHDLIVKWEAMTPGEYKSRGAGLKMEYGVHPTPFGRCFIAVTARGVCGLHFIGKDELPAVAAFAKQWKNAKLTRNQRSTKKMLDRIFTGDKPVRALCAGTQFQLKVWEALLRIPPGAMVSYQTVAKTIGAPSAVRAVASAIGKNAIAYLIPCHRVIRGLGHLGGYRWGLPRKQAMLAREAARGS